VEKAMNGCISTSSRNLKSASIARKILVEDLVDGSVSERRQNDEEMDKYFIGVGNSGTFLLWLRRRSFEQHLYSG